MLLYITIEPINQRLNTIGRVCFQVCVTFAAPSPFERPDVDRLCFFLTVKSKFCTYFFEFKG